MDDVTFLDRMKAAAVVNILRNQMSRTDAAKILGIKNYEVSFIERKVMGKGTSREYRYLAPKAAVRKVLEYGKTQGIR